MTNDKIVIHGAREHNLKDISLSIPKDKLVVITGLSGSGKSSFCDYAGYMIFRWDRENTFLNIGKAGL